MAQIKPLAAFSPAVGLFASKSRDTGRFRRQSAAKIGQMSVFLGKSGIFRLVFLPYPPLICTFATCQQLLRCNIFERSPVPYNIWRIQTHGESHPKTANQDRSVLE